MGLAIPSLISAFPVALGTGIPRITKIISAGWNWNAASAIFTAAMTVATMWMAWESRASRMHAEIVKKRQAFKAALVELVERNLLVMGITKALTAKGKILQNFLLGNIRSGVEYLGNYPETISLLHSAEISADVSKYVLCAIHKIKGLVESIEEEIGRALEMKADPSSVVLRRLGYLNLVLVQLGRVLLVEAEKSKAGVRERDWKNLLNISFLSQDLGPDISTAITIFPPLGELCLPRGRGYEKLSFSELVEEARRKGLEPVDQILEIGER